MTKSEALVCLSLHIRNILFFSSSHLLLTSTLFSNLFPFLLFHYVFCSHCISSITIFPVVPCPWQMSRLPGEQTDQLISVSLFPFFSLLLSLSLCNAHTKQLRDRKVGHSRQAPAHTHAKACLACTCAEWQKEKDTDTRTCMQVYSKCDLHTQRQEIKLTH